MLCADVPDVGIKMANIQISTPNHLRPRRACVNALTPVRNHVCSAAEVERGERREESGENTYIYTYIYMYIYIYIYIYIYTYAYIGA